MRILIAACTREVAGGAEKYLRVLIPEMLRRGHEVALLYEHDSLSASSSVDAGSGAPVWLWDQLREQRDWQGLSEWSPEVVYSQGLESADHENALLDRYPVVWYAHVYLGTCTTGRKCHAFPRLEPCDRSFGPMCLLMHYPRRCGGLNPLRTWRMYQRQQNQHARLMDYRAILVASAHMFRELQRNGVSAERLHHVALPPTDSSPLPSPPAPRIPGGKILAVSRLTDLKGIDHLIRAIPSAAARLGRDLTLTIAGDGPDRARLEELARRLQIKAEFAGWVGSSRRTELMLAADLLAVPSLWPEPFGLVGIEAGCVGLPAAGYAVGGIPDWLITGRTGELADANPPTVEGLADAIVRALRDPDYYARLCRGAWEMAKSFTLEAHAAALEGILAANSAIEPSAISSSLPGVR